MSDAVMVRLALSGENLARELDAALAPLKDGAARAGTAAGDSFASGLAASGRQIEAAVDGSTAALNAQEAALKRFNPLAAQYAADKARMTAETAQLRAALKAGEISQEAYNLAVIEGNTALKALGVQMTAAERAYLATFRATDLAAGSARGMVAVQRDVEMSIGGSRAGLQQLGQQLGDIATMFALGAPPAQIFGSQIGQVTQAVQLMGGGTSRVAAFLGGPWGIAISTAAIALSPFIGKIFETEEALDSMGEAAQEAMQRVRDSVGQAGAFTDAASQNVTKRINAMGALAQAEARIAEAQERMDALIRTPGGAQMVDGYRRVLVEASAAAREARTDIQEADDALQELRQLAGAQRIQERVADRQRSPARVQRGGGNISAPQGAVVAAQNDNSRSQQAEETARYIEGLEREIETLGLSGEALRQHEVQRQMAAAGSDAEREQIERLNQQRLEAISLIDRETEAKRVAAAEAAKGQQLLDDGKRANEELAEDMRRQQEAALRDVADLYEDLFSGNTDRIWRSFKEEGTRVLADIAAQWTLSLLSGQSGGKGAGGKSGGLGGLFGLVSGGGETGGLLGGLVASGAGTGGAKGKTTAGGIGSIFGGGTGTGVGTLAAAAGPVGMFAAATQVSNIIGEGLSDVLGIKYDSKLGSIFGLLGGIVGGLFKKTPAGQAGITSLDGSRISARGDGVEDNLTQMTGAFQDQLGQIAEALGAKVGAFSVSIGQRNDYFRVAGNASIDTGQKNTAGFLYDGKDAEQAAMIALRDAISDGAIQGISAASQRILQSGQDLEKAIEKAVLIESVPKLLRERLDPLGAALDEIDGKFRELADALKEGGASAEEIAKARQLWQLERADAVAQIGDASAQLKDYLLALNAGSSSPLSLRQQKAEAEAALSPFVAQIDAARSAQAEVDRLKSGGGSAAQIAAAQEAARAASAGVNQSGFQNAAELLLGISRQMDASGGGYFADFDRIRNLTGGAIGAIDGSASVAGAGTDPFAELTAQNTASLVNKQADALAMQADTNMLLREIAAKISNDNSALGYSWMGDGRSFV